MKPLHERLGALSSFKLRDIPETPAARSSYVEAVMFRVKLAAKKEPDIERIFDILEAVTTAAEGQASEAVITDETFDKYVAAALNGCCANPALYHVSAMQDTKDPQSKTYGQIVSAYAFDAALTALEQRKQVINASGNSEQGRVSNDQ